MPAPKRNNRSLAAIVGASAAAALLVFTPVQEGRVLKTYRDMGGVLTYCDGATENAIWGKTYTIAECNAQLDYDLARHAEGVNSCLPMDQLTLGQRIAFVDLAYNIGVTNFCRSSVARLARERKVSASCDALLLWNGIVKSVRQPDGSIKKVKTVVRGLQLRRERERVICLTRI